MVYGHLFLRTTNFYSPDSNSVSSIVSSNCVAFPFVSLEAMANTVALAQVKVVFKEEQILSQCSRNSIMYKSYFAKFLRKFIPVTENDTHRSVLLTVRRRIRLTDFRPSLSTFFVCRIPGRRTGGTTYRKLNRK